MDIKATQRYLIASPQKVREVAALIKKLSPSDAVARLPFLAKRASLPLGKVVKSAIANAKQKNLKEENLIFKEIQINQGPKLKRWRTGARGRVKPYEKKMSHIRVVLTTRKTEGLKPVGETVSIDKDQEEVKTEVLKSKK